MATARTISVLELNNITVGIYTNNLAAYKSLLARIPRELQIKVMSYSTVNRAVQEAGQHIDVPTALGIYVIKKTVLLRKAA
jgi:hypothetical protein